jgi:hypothetical protein
MKATILKIMVENNKCHSFERINYKIYFNLSSSVKALSNASYFFINSYCGEQTDEKHFFNTVYMSGVYFSKTASD